jgi:hypothetical protein
MPQNADLTALIDGDIQPLKESLDRATSAMQEFENGTGASLKRLDANFAEAFGNIRQHAASLESAITTALGAGAIGAGFYFLQSQTQKAADEFKKIGDEADKVAVTTDFFQTLGYEATKANVELSTVTNGLNTFSQQLAKLKNGEGDLKDEFEKTDAGLLAQLKGAKDVEAGVRIMSDAIARLKDPVDQVQLAGQAFGKSNSDMARILNDGAAVLRCCGRRRKRRGHMASSSMNRSSATRKPRKTDFPR